MALGGQDPGADDPFWGVVRREHPDIDLIVLDGPSPLDPPSGDVEQAIALDQARMLERGVDDVYASVLHLLPPDLPSPSRTWRGAPGGHAYVVEKALRESGGEAGLELLRALARHLHDRGWAVAATGDEQRPHLMATNGWIDLDGRSGRAATRLTVAGPVVRVRRDDLRVLEDEGGRP